MNGCGPVHGSMQTMIPGLVRTEKNKAWEYLLIARNDLERSGLPQPDPKKLQPKEKTKAWYAYRAWESMYAAEGSDWFWWYGTDQNTPAGEKPFDIAYITHLEKIYKFAKLAGGKMPKRDIQTYCFQRYSECRTAFSRDDGAKSA